MTAPSAVATDLDAEFDRQLRVLLDAGYPAAAGLAPEAFTALLAPLRGDALRHSRAGDPGVPDDRERVPFLLVVTSALLAVEERMGRTALNGRAGTVSPHLSDVQRFGPLEGVQPPAEPAYVVHGVERGSRYRNLAPDEALTDIGARHRSPLTVDEGIALVTLFPAALERNHCFSLAGSRCGDRRVPAVWISGRAPMLGWCWAGNPHGWLGCASCAGRSGGEAP